MIRSTISRLRRGPGARLATWTNLIAGAEPQPGWRVPRIRYVDAPAAPGVDVMEWMQFRGQLFATLEVPSGAVDGRRLLAVAAVFADHVVEVPVRMTGGRLSLRVPIPSDQPYHEMSLGLRCERGRRYLIANPSSFVTARHDFDGPRQAFVAALEALDAGLVVEVGSRDRSGITRSELVPPHLRYVGVDVVDGPNVDVIGDAHELSSLFDPESVDAVFSVATFEHLAMPWKCAVEINRVLKPGGLCWVLSHQTFPLHEQPWDYFRFSDNAWRALFNERTGFEILETAMGEAAAVAGLAITPITWGMDTATAYLGSAVLCRRTAPSAVDWPVDPAVVHRDAAYPA